MTSIPRHLVHTVAALSLVSGVAACSSAGEQPPSTTPSTASPSAPSSSSTGRAAAGGFADGTYTAKGWYGGQPSSIDVTVDLQDERIADVEVQTNATNPTSLDYQRRFADAVPDEVVGRPLADVEVGRLAGSSSTPDGFNDALEKIRAEASR